MRSDTFTLPTTGRARRAAPPAFTLIELLVVIMIIAVIMGILLPSIAGARTAARRTATQSMLTSLSGATAQFIIDKRSPPGYFSPDDMGDQENMQRGFAATQNLMLDLAGGMTDQTANGTNILAVGPRSAGTVNIDMAQIGASGAQSAGARGYYNPDGAYYVAQDPTVSASTSTHQISNVDAHVRLPTLVDSWGSPILAWVADEHASSANSDPALGKSVPDFAERTSNVGEARFFWAANACFLQATTLGRLGKDQTFRDLGSKVFVGSLIGGGSLADAEIKQSLEGLLGNPAFPIANYDATARPFAAAARGAIVYQSAGANGVFVGAEERGGKVAMGNGAKPYIKYQANVDVARSGEFDDVFVNAGN